MSPKSEEPPAHPGSAEPRARTAGPVPRRPWQVPAALTIIGLFWVGSMTVGMPDMIGDEDFGTQLAYMIGWTAVLALWMWRIWAGGPMAIRQMVTLATGFGALIMVGSVLVTVGLPDEYRDPLDVVVPVLVGGALLAAALLLRRPAVAEWARGRYGARRPPAGSQ
ncbi:hypothetical protein [Thermomonospora cellulosilytica]|uniref:Uncharacterized protein n=1 Tax=Thermomonospora cellulosilytica TaxID=1411118 RepID=A0A7W3N2A3_9ACTN|nr:hypothetical protein [Thermomonospora cellulosilytica]MBA9006192.1 hypothetical protein [Thermomonospora cellulosilytica]